MFHSLENRPFTPVLFGAANIPTQNIQQGSIQEHQQPELDAKPPAKPAGRRLHSSKSVIASRGAQAKELDPTQTFCLSTMKRKDHPSSADISQADLHKVESTDLEDEEGMKHKWKKIKTGEERPLLHSRGFMKTQLESLSNAIE
jgi:hypothetical protein